MSLPKAAARRGRPPTITHKRIAEAGIKLGLNGLTFTGVAAELGVSHMALYKHVANLEALKNLVAEEIFLRWQLPQAHKDTDTLQAYLLTFTQAVKDFVRAHPGVTPYVLRRVAATTAMLSKIKSHQQHIAEVFQLPESTARWLLATITFNSMAMANTVYEIVPPEKGLTSQSSAEALEMEAELDQGILAMIRGALLMRAEH